MSGVKIIALVVCAMLGSGAALSQTPQPERKTPSQGVEIVRFLADESSRLAFAILDRNRELAKSEENLLFSPFGIASAIAMFKCGAAGDTWSQLDLWGLRNGPPLGVDYGDEKINQVLARVIMLLQGSAPDIEVGLANSLWTDKSLAIGPGFPDGPAVLLCHRSRKLRTDPADGRRLQREGLDGNCGV